MNSDRIYSTLEQERIWIEASKRKTSEFEPIYNKYYQPIYRFIYRRTANEALTADLCSQTFYKALSNISKFTWQGKPLASWLYIIAGNEVKKYFRDRRPIFLIEEDKLTESEDFHKEWETLKHTERLAEVLNSLSELEVRIIEMKYFEGHKFVEMSELLDLKESTIKMRLYRLLNKIKQMLVADVEV